MPGGASWPALRGDTGGVSESEPGEIESGVLIDLARLPDEMQSGGIAAEALYMARMLDNGALNDLQPRDAASYLAQLRHCLVQLRDWAPGAVEDDPTDMARKNREGRLLHAVPEAGS